MFVPHSISLWPRVIFYISTRSCSFRPIRGAKCLLVSANVLVSVVSGRFRYLDATWWFSGCGRTVPAFGEPTGVSQAAVWFRSLWFPLESLSHACLSSPWVFHGWSRCQCAISLGIWNCEVSNGSLILATWLRYFWCLHTVLYSSAVRSSKDFILCLNWWRFGSSPWCFH
jgi:hypothetical protein